MCVCPKSIYCEFLGVLELLKSHTVHSILEKWNRRLDIYEIELEHYETFMTSDSGSNMVKSRQTACFYEITCIDHDLPLAIQRIICAVPEVFAAFQSGSNIFA